MTAHHWTFLARPTKGGHKYYRHHDSHEIGIADNSGSTPSHTDDGPLFLDVSKSRRAKICTVDGHLCVWLPVRDNVFEGEGRLTSVGTNSISDLAWLIHEGHIDVRHVDVSDEVRDVVTVAQAVLAVKDMGDVSVYREPVKKPEYENSPAFSD